MAADEAAAHGAKLKAHVHVEANLVQTAWRAAMNPTYRQFSALIDVRFCWLSLWNRIAASSKAESALCTPCAAHYLYTVVTIMSAPERMR